MRQAVSRCDASARGLKPARLFDARPKFPDRPKLGDGQELILVGGKTEEDQAARILEGHAVSLERAQISDGIGKREGKLLRLRSSGGVDRSPVADAEGAGETLRHKIGDEAGHLGRELAPRLGRDTARGHGAERIEAEADIDRAGRKPFRLHIVGDEQRRLPRGRTEIELDGNAPIEMHALECRLDRRFRRGKGIAVIADRSLEHEHDASRGVVQIVEDLLVGGYRHRADRCAASRAQASPASRPGMTLPSFARA